jgi:hypothetical protein
MLSISVVTSKKCGKFMHMLSIRIVTLCLRIVTYLIEYLSKFEFMFKIVLGYVSGNQMGSFEAKNEVENLTLGHL